MFHMSRIVNLDAYYNAGELLITKEHKIISFLSPSLLATAC
ncbi:conserved hypothetical protein [Vibrio jasicida]|uniref:Uncharacterized protein n=1 Tax=Vibrio jasicida TaxID=766224 RepID=A0AAU9QGN3_9VIBR|nr:conserved hypothetical protein [Vibrio jasicida]CAH1575777.1 conserved hypothetical protein [Vibrio jasicida]